MRCMICDAISGFGCFGDFTMPPQPLSRIKSGLRYRLHFDTLDERPNVAQAIAECIATWSRVDCAYGYLFVSMLKTNEKQGAELFASMESANSKIIAIKALAISSLSEQKVEILERLLRYTKSQQKVRDKIAHWVWGTSNELVDSMVLCDPKVMWAQSGKSLAQLSAAVKDGSPYCITSPVSEDYVYVYSKKDLKREAQCFANLAVLVERFTL